MHPNSLYQQTLSSNLTSWDDHLDKKYGKSGTKTREKFEQEFEAFKIGVLFRKRERNNI